MKNRVLLIGGNFSPELTGIGKYNGEMINWLSENGFECTVITTYPYYPEWKLQEPYAKNGRWFKRETKVTSAGTFRVIRCPHYVPKSPSALKRLISDISILFSTFIALIPFLFSKKYDYVMSVAPPFALGILGIFYKITKGAAFLYHVQDLQVDAARELNMIRSKFILDVLFATEKFILRNANFVSTISQGMIKKMNTKCHADVVYFPNWVNLKEFYPLNDKQKLKLNYGFGKDDKVILYSGAIGEKQGLESILHSAKLFIKDTNVKFLICGSGPYKQQLISIKDKLGLKNVFFLPLQPAEKFNEFLNLADVHLILQKANASDLLLPSKLTTVLAIGGVSIVTAKRSSSLYDIMNYADMGLVIEPENQAALDNAIAEAINCNSIVKGKNARDYAEKFLSIDSILSTFSEKVFHSKHVQAPAKTKHVIIEAATQVNV
jgi:colanic acid biosynthesis glycosyl transferase WcaI